MCEALCSAFVCQVPRKAPIHMCVLSIFGPVPRRPCTVDIKHCKPGLAMPPSREGTAARSPRRLTCRAGEPASTSPPSSTASPPGNGTSVQELKAALLKAVSGANNATLPSEAARLQREVEELAAQLAALNPTPDPASSPLISGSWALVYTGRSAILAPAAFGQSVSADSLKRGAQQALQAGSDVAYKFFYRFFPLIAGSAVGKQRGGSRATNIQVINLAGGTVDNIARFQVGSSQGEICVTGDVLVVPGAQTGGREVRLRVTFKSFTLSIADGPKVTLPLSWLSPLGFVDTLYLDQQMRVSVGDKGSLFVVVRTGGGNQQPSTAA